MTVSQGLLKGCRRLAAAGVLALWACAPAGAADLGGSPAPPPGYEPPVRTSGYNWTGLYFGATYGYASGTTTVASPLGGFDLDQSGGIGTVFGGYNFQAGNVVLGMEVDVGGLGNHGGSAGLGAGNVTSDLNWQASIRARAGVLVAPALLVYGTGGVAWSDFDVTANAVKVAQTFSGYQIGTGAELKLDPRWSLRLEYIYTGLGAEQIGHGGLVNSYEPDYHTVRAGLSFKF